MFCNPVYQKETKIIYRSIRTIAVILIFNGILAVVGIALLIHMVNNINFNGSAEYSAMLQLYILISALEFFLLMLITPGQTASAISGERERRTLDTMLSTNMTPTTIIMGKLEASLSTIFLLIISSLPVLSLVFIYGGIQFTDLFILFSVMFLNALYVGSAGICSSSYFRRTSTSTVAAYAFLFCVLGGTLLLSLLPSFANTSQTEFTVINGGNPIPWYHYFLLINPGITFYHIMSLQAGNPNALLELMDPYGICRTNFVIEHWTYISLGIQSSLTLLFLFASVHQIKSSIRRRK